mgnify:CR=1 FL=1
MTNQNIVLPAIALRGTTILPGMIVHFDVSRERSVKAIEAAMLHDQKIFLVTQIDPEVESPDLAGVYHCLYQTGCETSAEPFAGTCRGNGKSHTCEI